MDVRPGLIFWTARHLPRRCRRAALEVAWGPILKLVDEREKQIVSVRSSRRSSERAEAERLLAEQKAAIAEARREAAELAQRSKQEVETFRERADGQEPARRPRSSARRRAQQIQEEKAKAIAEVKGHGGGPGHRGGRQLIKSRSTTKSTARWPSSHRAAAGRPGGLDMGARAHPARSGQPSPASRRPHRGSGKTEPLFIGRNAPWLSPSASSVCRTWASPPSSTRSRFGRGAGGELPVLHHRAERGRGAGAGRAAGRSWPALVKPLKTIPTSLEFVDIAGLVARRLEGRGAGQPVPRQHPPGGRGAPRAALLRRRRTSRTSRAA